MVPRSEYPQAVELPYRGNDTRGSVRVELRENDDPAMLGCPELARGFPYCRATVEPPGKGYPDLFGWIQLDPYLPLGSASYPFTVFGLSPTFFDAPHADEDRDFVAHAFLCGLGGELHEVRREARAISLRS